MVDSTNLVVRIKSRDEKAYSDLVDLYGERVYNLALKMLRNPADAEDVLQETLMTVFEKVDSFHEQSDFFTWIYRIGTNFALMKIRQGKRETITDHDLDSLDSKIDLPTTPHTAYPDQIVLDKELKYELAQALQRIPEIYRTVFILRDLENLSTEETSKVLNITESNAKVRLRRARLFLRDELCRYFERCGDEEPVDEK